jgi:PilZ domain
MEYEPHRSVPRYILGADIDLIDVQSGIQISGHTVNFGLFGCRAITAQIFPKGSNLRIVLSHGGVGVEVFGRVVYASPDLGMGIAFTRVEPESERVLDGWLAELAGIPAYSH